MPNINMDALATAIDMINDLHNWSIGIYTNDSGDVVLGVCMRKHSMTFTINGDSVVYKHEIDGKQVACVHDMDIQEAVSKAYALVN